MNLTEWITAHRRLESERRRGELLDQRRQRAVQSLAAEIQTIKELADHRLTLPAAAARFRALALDRRGLGISLEHFRRCFPGRTDAERWCRRVIALMRVGVPGQPDLTARADELDAELTRDLARGPLHFPD